jgi:hypothetical protein
MSLYNILFGENPDADKLLNILELDSTYPLPPRYRDCWLDKDREQIVDKIPLLREVFYDF